MVNTQKDFNITIEFIAIVNLYTLLSSDKREHRYKIYSKFIFSNNFNFINNYHLNTILNHKLSGGI